MSLASAVTDFDSDGLPDICDSPPPAPTVNTASGTNFQPGQINFTGTGTPGNLIDCWGGSLYLGQTAVNPDGTWSLMTDPIGPGGYMLDFTETGGGGGGSGGVSSPPQVFINVLSPPGFTINSPPITNDNTVPLSGTANSGQAGQTVTVTVFDPAHNTTSTFTTTSVRT